jgi:Fur family ferric uptake transcriptional regulator
MPPTPRAAPTEELVRFERFLRDRSLKLTEERRTLVAAIFGTEHHFDADQLHMQLKQKGLDVSRATVYRTLDLMVQAGLVRKSSFGDMHAHYEAVRSGEHHDHLICLNCQKVIEFYRVDLEELQESICASHHFQALHHSHQIFGICAECVATGANPLSVAHRVSQLNA